MTSESPNHSLEMLPAAVAVLNAEGLIVTTNAAWRLFEMLEGAVENTTGPGVNYLDVCERASIDEPIAAEIADALRSVLRGERTLIEFEYPCHSPLEDRWFLMQAYPCVVADGTGAVVLHVDVSARRARNTWSQIRDSASDVAVSSPGRRSAEAFLDACDAVDGQPVGALCVRLRGLASVGRRRGIPNGELVLAHLVLRAERLLAATASAAFLLDGSNLVILIPPSEQVALDDLGIALISALSTPVQIGAIEERIAVDVTTVSAFDVSDLRAVGRPDDGTTIDEPSRAGDQPVDPMRVLLVSNSSQELATIRKLSSAGLALFARLTFAVSIEQAVEHLRREPFDCIIIYHQGGSVPTVDLDSIRAAAPDLALISLGSSASPVAPGPDETWLSLEDLEPDDLVVETRSAVSSAGTRRHRRRSEALRTLSTEVMLVLDREGRISYAGANVQPMLGIDADLLLGKLASSFIHHADLNVYRQALSEALRHGGPAGHDQTSVRFGRSDGPWRWVELSLTNLIDDPIVNGLVANVHERPDEIGTFGEVATERAKHRVALDKSRDVIMFFEADGTVTWTSESAQTVFGVPVEMIVGQNGLEMIHPEDRLRVIAEFAALETPGDFVRTEFRIELPDGTIRWVEEIVTNHLDEPMIGAMVGNIRDVTDRHRSEDAVRFQARLLAAVGQPVIAFDPLGQIVYWNDSARATFGWLADEVLGQAISDVFPDVSGHLGWTGNMSAKPTPDQSGSSEFEVRTKDGRQVSMSLTTTPLHDEAGDLTATIAVLVDLADQKQAEQLEGRMSAIVESSTDAIFSKDLDGRILTWNRAAEDLYGYRSDQIIGRHAEVLASPNRQSEATELVRRIKAGQTVKNFATVRRRAHGEEFHASVTVSPVRNRKDQIVAASVIARDITREVEARMALEQERRHLANAQRSARLGSFEIDVMTGEVHRSEELWRILGQTADASLGVDFAHIHPDDVAAVHDALDRALSGERDVVVDHRIVRPNGDIRWVTSRSASLHEGHTSIIAGTMLDITEQRTAELAMAHLAYHDQLTGLLNRAGLESLNGQAWEDPTALDRQDIVAIIDIDKFRSVNASLGNRGGDVVLQQIAGRIGAVLDDGAVLCRFTGDEFVVVSNLEGDDDDAETFGDRLCAVFDEPFVIDQRTVRMSATVGIKRVDQGDSIETAIRDADAAKEHARRSGVPRAVFSQQLQQERQRTQQIETSMVDALDDNQFTVVFQPVVELASQRTVGFEALLRWSHPLLGIVQPAEFIAAAERTGFILSLGEWALRQSLAQIAVWRTMSVASSGLWVAVNLSVRQLEQLDLATRIEDAIDAAGVDAQALHLEVTESVLIANFDNASKLLGSIRTLGVTISIDDFGTGYSSLRYVQNLPVDVLKIDRSFVNDLGIEAHSNTIAQTVIGLANHLDLQVIAEGVETPEQLEVLVELGCQFGQGFLWSRGINAVDATEWLRRDRDRPPA